ncbi:MAG: hypothetical protein QXU99_06260 [Candidatus Bathyarchaeia archaeon]
MTTNFATTKATVKHSTNPTVLTDTTMVPRQSFYACTYCMPKLNIATEDLKVINGRAADYPTVFDLPAKFAHFSGLLNPLP